MCEAIPMELSNTFHRIFVLFQIIVVVCLIFFSILDVLKIITSQDEDNIKKKTTYAYKKNNCNDRSFFINIYYSICFLHNRY